MTNEILIRVYELNRDLLAAQHKFEMALKAAGKDQFKLLDETNAVA